MSFTIKPATRQAVRPLIGLYAESGCGKTYGALLLARGFVGPAGKIVLADSESGRGSLYADVIQGGYDTLNLEEPFSPDNYIGAVRAIEQSGAQIGIIDSASHEWEGLGGVTDMAADIERTSGKPGLHCWKAPKMAHAKFMLKLLQSPIPWIICLRAKYKSRQVKEGERTKIIRDEHASPIQAEEFIFEMTAHCEILQDHSIRLTKCSHPSLKECFPTQGPLTSEHGKRIAEWCNSAGEKKEPAKTTKLKDPAKILKKQLWEATAHIHMQVPAKLEQYLWDEGYIDPNGETLANLSAKRLQDCINKLQQKSHEHSER